MPAAVARSVHRVGALSGIAPDAVDAARQVLATIAANERSKRSIDFSTNRLDRLALPFLTAALPVSHDVVAYAGLSEFVDAIKRRTLSGEAFYFNAVVPMSDRTEASTVHVVAMSLFREAAREGAPLSLIYVEPAPFSADDIADAQHDELPYWQQGNPIARGYHDFFKNRLPVAFADNPEMLPSSTVLVANVQKSQQDCAIFSFFLARKMTPERMKRPHARNVVEAAARQRHPRVYGSGTLPLDPVFYKHAHSLTQLAGIVEGAPSASTVNKKGEGLLSRAQRYFMTAPHDASKIVNGSILYKRRDYMERALATL